MISTKGWGAHDNNQTINGGWSDYEIQSHTNVLEQTEIKILVRFFLLLK